MDHASIGGNGVNEQATNVETNAMLADLRRVRRRVRALLVVEAIGRLIAWVILMAAILAVLDWWVRFPWFVRINFLALGTVFALWWAYRAIWRPLTAPIHLDQLALGLKALPAHVKDRLAGTVAYLQAGGEGSDEMWRQVVSETIRSTEGLPSRGLLRARPAIRSTLSTMGALTAVGLVAWLAPGFVSTGVIRLARPFAAVEWPKAAQISPLTTDVVVAWGEAFTAQMRLDRGDRASTRAFVHWSSSSQHRQREQMRRDADGVYRFTLENIRSPLSYSFSAGDDDTANRPFQVKVVKRPAVTAARVTVTPPPYARHLPAHSRVLDDAPVTALRGSQARFDVTPDRPIGSDGASKAALILDGECRVPLIAENPAGAMFSANVTLDRSTTIETALVDADGLESRGGPVYRIRVRPDELPTVAIQRPAGVSEATPAAIVELQATAQDDVGLAAFTLLASKNTPEFQTVADLLTIARDGPSEGESASRPAPPPLRCALVYSWNIETLKPVPGDAIRICVEARDGFDLDGRTHEPVRSLIVTINIISLEQFADRLRSELMAVRGPLRDLLTDLLAAAERTQQLDQNPAAATPLDATERQAVESLVARLQRLTAQSRQAAEKTQEVAQRAARNGAATSESMRQAERLARRLRGSVEERLKEAAQSLARSGDARKADVQHEHLQASRDAQDEVAGVLQSMLDEVERWSEFEELVRKLREVLDRQEALERDTASLARIAGRSLGETGESSLPMLAARQSQLRSDVSTLIQTMQTWARQKLESETAASLSVDAAARLAEEKALPANMDQATQSIAEGRFSRASEAQRGAAAILRAMIAALEKKPDRELADLSRALQDLTARLRKIIAAQEALLRDTEAAASTGGAEETLLKLADRQMTLHKTSRAAAAKVKDSEEEGPAARKAIHGAADRMQTAGELLEQAEAANVPDAQRDALDGLHAALELLERLEGRTEQAIAERSLAQIVALLGDLRRAQAGLRGETAEIHARSSSDRRLSRADSLRAAKLAKDQRGLTTPLQEVREKLKSSVVYDYVCMRIAERMESAAARLEEKDCPAALSEQDDVLRELADLLQAAAEEPKKDEARFVDDSGGGGAGSPTPEKPVPTLAELKVLRRLQTEVNARTAALDRSMPDPLLRTESQLEEIQLTGGLQKDIHELAVKMIDKSEEPNRDGADGDKEEKENKFNRTDWPFFLPGFGPTTQPVAQDQEATLPPKRKTSDSVVDEELVRRLLGGQSSVVDAVEKTITAMDDAAEGLRDRLDTGEKTQRVQVQVLEGIDQLIAEARKNRAASRDRSSTVRRRQARPGGRSSPGTPAKSGEGKAPAAVSRPADPQDAARRGRKGGDADKTDLSRGWGYLPQRDREEISQGFDEQFPEKYRERILEYYRSLADEARRNAEE
ncbi:MAG TPA: hypothetical protein VJZ71_04550 [Phycisphaerae bacterium]|nr:hypothetical protein [Phycisphaerae bacterium]